MMRTPGNSVLPGLLLVAMLGGCAATNEAILVAPSVELTSVELESVSLDRQTFVLGFEVSNPNLFPLPVDEVRYRVMFDEARFADGETRAAFTVPAGGTDTFSISVNLDLLGSAMQVSSLLRGGVPDHVNYRVDGSLSVDIPFARPLPFAASGAIRIQ